MTTDLITILPADVPYEDTLDNGCLLTDSDVHFLGTHLRPAFTRKAIEDHKLNPIPVRSFTSHPHAVMKKLGIDWSLVIDAATYECPILKQDYLSVVPYYLLTADFLKYEFSNEFRDTQKDMLNDADWNQHWYSGDKAAPDRFTDCLLGPGYTSGFLPSDGGNDYALASFKLSNGDYLIVKTFTWFNK